MSTSWCAEKLKGVRSEHSLLGHCDPRSACCLARVFPKDSWSLRSFSTKIFLGLARPTFFFIEVRDWKTHPVLPGPTLGDSEVLELATPLLSSSLSLFSNLDWCKQDSRLSPRLSAVVNGLVSELRDLTEEILALLLCQWPYTSHRSSASLRFLFHKVRIITIPAARTAKPEA